VVVEEPSSLPTKFERMVTTEVVQGVRQYISRVRATLREAGWSTKVKACSGDCHLRQSNRFVDTTFDPEICWIEMSVWIKEDVDSIETKPCFVNECGAK